ncbi:MAG TPA: hybrid sensor histidine kinase/response regulator [Abditibacteriaceae bacterium]|jgi:signal transduction histidine kinase
MQPQTIRVLLVEDNPTDVLLVEASFEEMAMLRAEVVVVERVSAAVEELAQGGQSGAEFTCVLLDLTLPDNQGLEAFKRIAAAAANTPVIVLTGLADEAIAVEALQLGASDYLVKGQSTAPVLERSIRYAIERKRTENQRVELMRAQTERAEAEEASRAKDVFLATLSHELRTPLNSILGWTHLLRTGVLSEVEQQEALEVIERNSQAQARLVEDLLDVSRFITGKLYLNTGIVDLATIIHAVTENLRPQATEKHIELRVETTPVSIDGDMMRLQQVVANLLANALKFTPAGGEVAVHLKREEKAGQSRAVLEVSDSGEGIAPEFLPHVFDRFRQADSSPTRNHGGLGLGLAITRNLVELHGGTISVQSDGVGKGAAFVVELPFTENGS